MGPWKAAWVDQGVQLGDGVDRPWRSHAGRSHRGARLCANSLWKRYGRGEWALEDISLAIPAGRIVALVGPNSAGKSTLLRTWLGFEQATRGAVRAAGVDPWRQRGEAIRHVGYIPQHPALYDELSVEEHIDLAAYLRRGLDRALALKRIDQLGLPRRSRASQLSGGQRAQLGLAIVLAAGATILLLDEPLASLDPLARREDLVKLVAGRLRLHTSIEAARASHRLVLSADALAASADVVGRFATNGSDFALVRVVSDELAVGGIPSLEEVVLGYLAADSRATASHPA